jgi:hypothetical protein
LLEYNQLSQGKKYSELQVRILLLLSDGLSHKVDILFKHKNVKNHYHTQLVYDERLEAKKPARASVNCLTDWLNQKIRDIFFSLSEVVLPSQTGKQWKRN